MKQQIFDAPMSDWDEVLKMNKKVNEFLAANVGNVARISEVVVGMFIVIFIYLYESSEEAVLIDDEFETNV